MASTVILRALGDVENGCGLKNDPNYQRRSPCLCARLKVSCTARELFTISMDSVDKKVADGTTC